MSSWRLPLSCFIYANDRLLGQHIDTWVVRCGHRPALFRQALPSWLIRVLGALCRHTSERNCFIHFLIILIISFFARRVCERIGVTLQTPVTVVWVRVRVGYTVPLLLRKAKSPPPPPTLCLMFSAVLVSCLTLNHVTLSGHCTLWMQGVVSECCVVSVRYMTTF